MHPPITPTTVLLVLLAVLLASPPVYAQLDPEITRDLRAQLADILVEQQVSGDHEATSERLRELVNAIVQARAAADRADLLASVLIARARAMRDAGDRSAVAGLLIPGPDDPMTVPDEELLEVMELVSAVNQHASVITLRAELIEWKSLAQPTADAGIDAAVSDALARGHEKTFTELGVRAIEPLIARLQPNLTSAPPRSQDAYHWLAVLDPARAMAVVRDQLERDILVAPERAALAAQIALGDYRFSMLFFEGRSTRIGSDDLLAVLTQLFGRVELWQLQAKSSGGRDVHDMARALARNDAFEPDLARGMGAAALSLSHETCQLLLEDLGLGRTSPSLLPFYEVVIAHEHELVRRTAAMHLARTPLSRRLLEVVDDPDPAVREHLAQWFSPRDVTTPLYRLNGVHWQQTPNIPNVVPEARPVLARLCRDPVRSVRLAAVKGLLALDRPLADDVYERLVHDSDSAVRRELASLRHPDEALLGRLMAALAGDADPVVRLTLAGAPDLPADVARDVLSALAMDPDPAVRERAVDAMGQEHAPSFPDELLLRLVDDDDPRVRASLARCGGRDFDQELRVLERLAQGHDSQVLAAVDARLMELMQRDEWQRGPVALLALLRQRRFDALHPLGWSTSYWFERRIHSLGVDGRLELYRWALRAGTDEQWEVALSSLEDLDLARNNDTWNELNQAWQRLDDDELFEVAERMLASDRTTMVYLCSSLDPLPEAREQLALRLMRAWPEEPLLVLLGARALARRADPASLDQLVAALVGLDQQEVVPITALRSSIRSVFRHLPIDRVNAVAQRVVQMHELSDSLRWYAAYQLRAEEPGVGQVGEVALARAVLDAFYPSDAADSIIVVTLAVELLAARDPETIDSAWLVGALRTPLGPLATRKLAERRDPSTVPALRDALLDGPSVASAWLKNSESNVRPQLVDALVSFLSDDAAEALLVAASEARSSKARATIMDGVTRIQDWQDARSNWEQRLATRATRESAVTELLALLDDDDPLFRAEAARGLATLQAVEHLPRLVLLLKDDDERVRAAARAALDRMHALAEGPATAGG